jgi:hypothetical protein
MVLQAFNWSQYPNEADAVNPHFPTQPEMLAMRDSALVHKPSMILWYDLADIQRSDNPAKHWQDLVSAAFAPFSPDPIHVATATATAPATPTVPVPQPSSTKRHTVRPAVRRRWHKARPRRHRPHHHRHRRK